MQLYSVQACLQEGAISNIQQEAQLLL